MKTKVILLSLCLIFLSACGLNEEMFEKAVANVVYADEDGNYYYAEVDAKGVTREDKTLEGYYNFSIYKQRVVNNELMYSDREHALHITSLETLKDTVVESQHPSSGYFLPWEVSDNYVYMVDIQSGGSFIKQYKRDNNEIKTVRNDDYDFMVEDYDIDYVIVNDDILYVFLYQWKSETITYEIILVDAKLMTVLQADSVNLSKYGNSMRSHIIDGDNLYMSFSKNEHGENNTSIVKMDLKTLEVTSIPTGLEFTDAMKLVDNKLYISDFDSLSYTGSSISVIDLDTNDVTVSKLENSACSFIVEDKNFYMVDSDGKLSSYKIKKDKLVEKKAFESDKKYISLFPLSK